MKDLEAIKVLVKRVQYQEIVIDGSEFEVPDSAEELVNTMDDIKNDTDSYCSDSLWETDHETTVILSTAYIEKD
jgi:hypothetical protein